MIRDLPNPDQQLAPSGTYPCEACDTLFPTSDVRDTVSQKHLRYHGYCSLLCASKDIDVMEKIIEDMDREIAAQAALITDLKAEIKTDEELLNGALRDMRNIRKMFEGVLAC